MGDPEAEATRAVTERVRAFLRERFGRHADGFDVTPLSGDASTRRYFRLTCAGERFVVACYPESFSPDSLSFCVVHTLLERWGLPVPGVLGVDGPRAIVLLEDLGDCTLQLRVGAAGAEERGALYREAIERLLRLQQEAARSDHRGVCFEVAFDREKLVWELHYFEKHFLEGWRACDLTAEDRATLAEGFHGLAEEISGWPRVLCHRDYHSRNLMWQEGRLRWIDYQDARLGPLTYDLASLLRDSYVDLDEALVAEMLWEFQRAAAPAEARESFLRRFDLTSAQRNLKALGTFGYQAAVRKNLVYLEYLPRTIAHARRNLERYPELSGIARVLSRHLQEFRS
jgi:aminoglycoside/choline kinase family phosphotransferase